MTRLDPTQQPKKPPVPAVPGAPQGSAAPPPAGGSRSLADAFKASGRPVPPPPTAETQYTLGNPNAPAPKTAEIPHTLGNPNAPLPPTMPMPAAPQPSTPKPAPLPDGREFVPTKDGSGWVPPDHPQAAGGEVQVQAPPLQPEPGMPAPPTPGMPAPAQPGAPGQPTEPTTVADAFKKTLIDKLNGGNAPANINDPALKAQSDAFAVGQTRASELQRAQSAERLAAQGLASSGAADSEYSGINERAGENMAGFNAQLVGDEAKRRQQELLSYAAIAGGQLNAEEARALQKELANLDAQIKREGMAQNDRQFGSDLDLRRYGIDKQSDLGGRDLDLRRYGIDVSNNLGLLDLLTRDRFNNRSLDQQGAQFGAGMDLQTILGLLGGL